MSVASDTSSDRPLAAVNKSPTVRVVRSLREWISGGQWGPGERLPAEMDLVERLSASRGTIRTALQQLTDEGLVVELPGRGRKSRGRIVAPTVRSGAGGLMARTVGLVTHGLGALSDDPIRYAGGRAELAVGSAATQALHAAGMHVLSISAAAFEESEVHHLIADAPYGLIATHPSCNVPRIRVLLERLSARGVRVIATGHDSGPDSESLSFDRVLSDHESGGYELARWLLARGHRRIIEMGAPSSDLGWVKARSRGYRRALEEVGLEPLGRVRAENISPGIYDTNGTTESPRRRGLTQEAKDNFELRVRQITGFVAAYVLGSNPVDAIMATNDWDASIILGACRLLGLEPNKQVAVVGYDDWVDTEEREWEPAVPLATVDKRNADIGREAARMLIDRAEGKLPAGAQIRLLQPRLVELGGKIEREAELAEAGVRA